MKGAPRLQTERHHPLAPHVKTSDAPSRRRNLGAQGATWSISALQSPTSFFFFSFSSSPASGCKGQREALISFFSFLGPKQRRLVPILLKEHGPKQCRFGPFYFKKNRPKRRNFGACSFKIKNRPKWRHFGHIFHYNPPFLVVFNRQLFQILP